jgi:DNA polymerase III subunit beta
MKFSAPASALHGALVRISLALADKSNVMALRMARLSAAAAGVALTVDALDRVATVTIPADVLQPGEGCARCAAFAGLVAGLNPEAIVELERIDDNISVRCGRSRYIVDGLPVDALPRSATLADDAAPAFPLDRKDFARLISATAYAISDEASRYYLNGIHLHTSGTDAAAVLRATSTDGYRLAQCELSLPAGAENMPAVTVPGSTIDILTKLLRLKPQPETVAIRVTNKLIEFSLGTDLVLASKLIDASFPDTGRVIPKPSDNNVTIERQGLIDALARVEALIDENSKRLCRIAGLAWAEDGALHVQLPHDVADDLVDADTAGVGRASARISYLHEALDETFVGARVTVDTAGADCPIRITDPDDGASLAVVMTTKW